MALGIPGTARHGPNRQHNPTLTLFEIRMQRLASEKSQASCRARCHVALHRCPHGVILHASFRRIRANCLLAALVLEVDTIPKPDGLGAPRQDRCEEHDSNTLGHHPMKFESRSSRFESPVSPN